MIFYFIDDKLVKCNYKHTIKSEMKSNDTFFLYTNAIEMYNDRNNKDIAVVNDILYEGT